jgi:hypothetical protein
MKMLFFPVAVSVAALGAVATQAQQSMPPQLTYVEQRRTAFATQRRTGTTAATAGRGLQWISGRSVGSRQCGGIAEVPANTRPASHRAAKPSDSSYAWT